MGERHDKFSSGPTPSRRAGTPGHAKTGGLGRRLDNCFLRCKQQLTGTHEEAQTAMGANSKQGWCMFGLLIGFILVAGGWAGISEGASGPLAALAVLVGVVLTVASGVGFYVIKPLEHEGTTTERSPVGATTREARVK